MPETPLRELIQSVIRSNHPGKVGQLAQLVYEKRMVDEADFVATVKAMSSHGSLALQDPVYRMETVPEYLFTPSLSVWLWFTLIVSASALAAITLTPDVYPLVTVRWFLGSVFVLYLPGYALVRLLFPRGSKLDSLERFALSVGLSLAVVPLIGLLLNYTPWGIRFAPIVTALGFFTILSTIAAAGREYTSVHVRSTTDTPSENF